jgi:hypothetical protein
MKEHGIWTTLADYWIHFHPLEAKVYWYLVDRMREYIQRQCDGSPCNCSVGLGDNSCWGPINYGRSKDPNKTATGEGFLIEKSLWFIARADVPSLYINGVDWLNLSDREFGAREGEERVFRMIGRVIVPTIELRNPNLIRKAKKDEQLQGWDVKARFDRLFEIKTERVISNFLFVQRAERGHRVHHLSNGTEKYSEYPGEENGAA